MSPIKCFHVGFHTSKENRVPNADRSLLEQTTCTIKLLDKQVVVCDDISYRMITPTKVIDCTLNVKYQQYTSSLLSIMII